MSLDFPRQKLGHFPTPIEFLKNISNHLGGPKIYIKRDDCTGLATGGNKTRKLEYLMPDAIKNKATKIRTANDRVGARSFHSLSGSTVESSLARPPTGSTLSQHSYRDNTASCRGFLSVGRYIKISQAVLDYRCTVLLYLSLIHCSVII